MIRVLIVDDHAVVRSGLRMLIDAEDDMETVGEAGNVRDAVFEARSTTPDLILMDLGMPEMDGWIATEQIKSDDATKSIPLYALTAHTLPKERKRAMDAGCDGYVSKPIQMDGFLDMVAGAFGTNKRKKATKKELIK